VCEQGVPVPKPQKLPPNQFDHFYKGGNRIGALRGGPGGPMRPEEWIGSTTTRFGEKRMGLSTLANGDLLLDAINRDPSQWLGGEHLAHFGSSTELLVKLLDPDQRLPVHFHPNKRFAKDHLDLKHGKTEAWIILEAPVDAHVGLGFNREMNKREIAELVDKRDSTTLLDSLQNFPVRAGDAVLVPAGTPHAIGAGIFVLELQEPTDLSALLEWNDFAVDGTKDGHLGLGFDTVLDALRYEPINNPEELITSARLSGLDDRPVFTQSANPYFRADFLSGTGGFIPASFGIFLTLSGEGSIDFASAPQLEITKGDAIVIPFAAGEWRVRGATGVICRPPLPDDAKRAV
jgi:mannose-6-phosphate isomerase